MTLLSKLVMCEVFKLINAISSANQIHILSEPCNLCIIPLFLTNRYSFSLGFILLAIKEGSGFRVYLNEVTEKFIQSSWS